MYTRLENIPYDAIYNLMIMGDKESGKSNFILRYSIDGYSESRINYEVAPKEKSIKVKDKVINQVIWETGPAVGCKNWASVLKNVDACIITVDMTNSNSLQNLQKCLDLIRRDANKKVFISVVATKIDMKDKFVVNRSKLEKFVAENNDIGMLNFVSSQENLGVTEVFNGIAKNLLVRDQILVEKKEISGEAEKKQLKELLLNICTNYDLWKDKVRCGPGSDGKVLPDGVRKFRDILQNNSIDIAFQLIGECATYKHSEHFQFLHSFFRGRDSKANDLYGVLSKLNNQNFNTPSVTNSTIEELNGLFITKQQKAEENTLSNI